MRRVPTLLAAFLAAALALAPGLADARAGGGGSFGSRGSRTWSAPPVTNTAPFAAQPMQRSMTPRAEPAPGAYGAPSGMPPYGYGYGRRSAFTSGLLGGLLGAGLGGLLFGHGLFGGISGFGSFLGFLLQIFLLVMLVRFLLRRFAGGPRPAYAGPGLFGRMMNNANPGGAARGFTGGQPRAPAVQITRADYEQFEALLRDIQAAWSAQDTNALRRLVTPEMAGYFGEQLAEQASRGLRNVVSDVRLLQGDLAEAWTEGGREYATVAMRFSMIDVTYDAAGRIVDGNPNERITSTELWTFLRSPGGRWVLSAIQQAR